MIWDVVFDKLEESDLNPYPPGVHEGLCDKNYCVILEGTQMPDLSSRKLGRRRIDIIAFVPISDYSEMYSYTEDIKESLSEISYLKKTGLETPIIVEDLKEALSSSIEYIIMKKLEG